LTFATDTAVATDDGIEYTGEIIDGWDVVGNANGGYLMAIAARAMTDAADRPHPVSVTCHFLSPGRPGPVSIKPEIIKRGRTLTTVRADLRTTDRTVLTALGTFSDLDALEGPVLVDATPPDLPDPEDCIWVHASSAGIPPALMDRIELRLHPDNAGFANDGSNGAPLIRGWVRPLGGEPLDVFTLLLAVDCFPPTIFQTGLHVAWTPTDELTAHIRGVPEPGWLRCRFSTRFITGGLLEEDGEVWDTTGRLVAQSRQLALTPRG
jgi:acyl-CoA thioesterase